MLIRKFHAFLSGALMVAVAAGRLAHADDYVLDAKNSLVGFYAHKGGMARSLIEDPLTYPGEMTVSISVGESVDDFAFDLAFDLNTLIVADAEVLARWSPAIREAGVFVKPPKASSPARRLKIRRSLLSKKFLDAENYPAIRGRVFSIAADPSVEDRYEVTIDITMHGQTVRAKFPALIARDGNRLSIDGIIPLRFTDFGVKPFSSFFGAIKYRDGYHVCVFLRARRK